MFHFGSFLHLVNKASPSSARSANSSSTACSKHVDILCNFFESRSSDNWTPVNKNGTACFQSGPLSPFAQKPKTFVVVVWNFSLLLSPSLSEFGFASNKWSSAGTTCPFACLNHSNIFWCTLWFAICCSFLRTIQSNPQVITRFCSSGVWVISQQRCQDSHFLIVTQQIGSPLVCLCERSFHQPHKCRSHGSTLKPITSESLLNFLWNGKDETIIPHCANHTQGLVFPLHQWQMLVSVAFVNSRASTRSLQSLFSLGFICLVLKGQRTPCGYKMQNDPIKPFFLTSPQSGNACVSEVCVLCCTCEVYVLSIELRANLINVSEMFISYISCDDIIIELALVCQTNCQLNHRCWKH